jgi:ATP-binding cassette subfamily F protein 3
MPGATVLDALLATVHVEQGPARSYLARFLFRGDEVFKPVVELSGGERSRLELALLGVSPANLLLLDEPTNHLDIPAREALESFLRESPATLIVVSHDRRLLDSVCQTLWVVEASAVNGRAGRVAPFEGGYRGWRSAVSEGWTVEAELARRSRTGAHRSGNGRGAVEQPKQAPPVARRPSAGRQAPLSKDAYRRQLQRVEDDLTRLGLRKSQLELALGDRAVQANFVELRRLSSELADVDAALGQAEDAWLALSERAPR